MNVNYNLCNHEPSILCGSPAQLTLKLPRSECQSSPLAVVHFFKISYENLVVSDQDNNFEYSHYLCNG